MLREITIRKRIKPNFFSLTPSKLSYFTDILKNFSATTLEIPEAYGLLIRICFSVWLAKWWFFDSTEWVKIYRKKRLGYGRKKCYFLSCFKCMVNVLFFNLVSYVLERPKVFLLFLTFLLVHCQLIHCIQLPIILLNISGIRIKTYN